MKRYKSISLFAGLLALCLLLSACSSLTPALPIPTDRAAEQTTAAPAAAPETTLPAAETVPQTTAAPETEPAPELEIPFYSYSRTETDAKGYVLEQTLQFSPWISQNEPELLEAAWAKVSRGKAFPSLGELGFTKNYVIAAFGKNYIEYDEVLFSVGTLEVFNRTEGFPISESDPNSPSIGISGANRFNTLTLLYGNGSRTYYSVALGVFGTQGGGWSPITIKMQSDHWGPVPVVLAQAIDKTPNHPNGDPACEDVVLKFGSNSFTLPVLTPDNLAELAAGEELDPDAEPQPETAAVSAQGQFHSVEIEDFRGFEGMTRAQLRARFGAPSSDDGSVMTYDDVSWNGWAGNYRFFFSSSSDDCKTNCGSWTAEGNDELFEQLCTALRSSGYPGETSYPKDGQVEKAFLLDGFELIAGNENSADGKWTYLFARYHD